MSRHGVTLCEAENGEFLRDIISNNDFKVILKSQSELKEKFHYIFFQKVFLFSKY